MTFQISRIRDQFPALALQDNGESRVYFDNPGGTQVPRVVLERIRDCLVKTNANLGGQFRSSIEMGQVFADARSAMAEFLGAASGDELIFGQNMTSLTFHMSRCIGRALNAGDEIVVTEMDHEGNVSPWLLVARDRGCAVRWLPFEADTCEFDLDKLDAVLSERTKVVAIGYASNLMGTVNDIAEIVRRIRLAAPSAIIYVDAVQFAAHGLIDVQVLGCDMLVCSPYKFFGPHVGVLWGRRDVLERLDTYKARPSADTIPVRFETGTLGHESAAGVLGTIEYFRWIGQGGAGNLAGRDAIAQAWKTIGDQETHLLRRLIEGLRGLKNIRIHGITEPNRISHRVPTVAITSPPFNPVDMARYFASQAIFVWSGHSYSVEACRRLGLLESGGVVRIGLAHYNTVEEVDRLLQHLERMPFALATG